jgi:hypothetical protein
VAGFTFKVVGKILSGGHPSAHRRPTVYFKFSPTIGIIAVFHHGKGPPGIGVKMAIFVID